MTETLIPRHGSEPAAASIELSAWRQEINALALFGVDALSRVRNNKSAEMTPTLAAFTRPGIDETGNVD